MFSVVLLATAASVLVACVDRGASDGKPRVAVAFFPIEEVVRRVGGDAVHVIALVPPGEDAHEYDPTPQQLTALEKTDVVVYLGKGFQPNLQKAIDSLPSSIRRVDLLNNIRLLPVGGALAGTNGTAPGETLGDGNDPHVWLDPTNMKIMAAAVASALTDEAPAHASAFDANSAVYERELAGLTGAYQVGLANCATRVLVTSHRAFGYLAAAFHLTQVSIAGISPNDEPSAKTIKAVADYAHAHGVSTVFFQNTLPADLAATVAREIGARTAMLDSVESPSRDDLRGGANYNTIMRADLDALRTGLECT